MVITNLVKVYQRTAAGATEKQFDNSGICRFMKGSTSMKTASNKLQSRDLVTTGIFTAIYMVICVIFEVIGGLGPLVWVFMPSFLALVCGPVYMTLVGKVPKKGVVFLMGFIPALIFSVRGGYFFILIVTAFIAGTVAEIIRKSMGYDSENGKLISYAVFSLGMVGNLLPIWIFRESFLVNMVDRGMPADYVQAMEAATPMWMLFVMIVVTFIVALIGGKIGQAIVKKHFEKAGMIK